MSGRVATRSSRRRISVNLLKLWQVGPPSRDSHCGREERFRREHHHRHLTRVRPHTPSFRRRDPSRRFGSSRRTRLLVSLQLVLPHAPHLERSRKGDFVSSTEPEPAVQGSSSSKITLTAAQPWSRSGANWTSSRFQKREPARAADTAGRAVSRVSVSTIPYVSAAAPLLGSATAGAFWGSFVPSYRSRCPLMVLSPVGLSRQRRGERLAM